MDLNKHYFCNFSFSFVSKFHGGVSKITKMYSFEPRRLVSDQNRAHLCEHEAGRGAAGAPRPPRAPRGFTARIGVARWWAHGREAVTLLAPRTQSRRRPRARLRLPPRPAAAAVRGAVWRSSVPAPCCTRLPWPFVFLSMDLNSSRRRLSQTTPPPAPSHPPFHARVFRFSVIPLRVEFASHGKEVFPGKELAAVVVPHASWPRVGTRQYWGVKWRLVGFVIRVCPALGSWRPLGTTPRRPDLRAWRVFRPLVSRISC